MTSIGIIHHSGTGYTRILADAVARGALTQDGAKIERLEVLGSDIREGRYANEEVLATLDACDAIIFGTPTYMGGVSAQMKAFLDATVQRWYARMWAGKLAAAFTVSSTPSGDKFNALTDVFTCALQHGMIWVGLDESPLNKESVNRLGFYLGAAAQPDYSARPAALQGGDAETGARLGARVARLAAEWSKVRR
jgi:NAD(P)H dehydrogenase (quinone)